MLLPILGIIAFIVVVAGTWKLYRKMKKQKAQLEAAKKAAMEKQNASSNKA